MTYRKTMLSASILAALMFTGAAVAHDGNTVPKPKPAATQPSAQQTTTSQQASDQATRKAQEQKVKNLNAVIVVGIRNAAALSLELQKAAVSDINVVTAEDVGKLPAKNVADALQALPGVELQAGSAGEGGFDENDRVSLRGTSPSMTLTEVNGHPIASADWFVLNQTQTVGRSINYGLLPSEIVSEVVVHKSSEASLNEGGATGTVNVITRRPLQFQQPLSVHASIGGVYADLPKKTDPQVSALLNFKNSDNTFGILVQGFFEKRHLQRDGQEILGMSEIPATAPFAAGHPDLAGVYMPSLIDSALFTQVRKRKGGTVNVQFKPSDSIDIDFEGFYSKTTASNLNRSLSFWGVQALNANGAISDYVVQHNLLTSMTLTSLDPTGQSLLGVYDQIGRPGASMSTGYVTGDLKWTVSENFTFHAQAGYTQGKGKSPAQNVLETNINATGASYSMTGLGSPINWTLGDNQFANPTNASHTTVFGWIFGDQDISVKSENKWVNLDGTLDFLDGPLESLQFGARYADNTKGNAFDVGQGPVTSTDVTTMWEALPINGHYPGNFNSQLGMSSGPESIWYLTLPQLAQINSDGRVNRTVSDPLYSFGPDADSSRFNPGNVYHVGEKDLSLYAQANFSGNNWAGNVGVRWVHTKQTVQYTSAGVPGETSFRGPYSSAFYPSSVGGYYLNFHHYNYSKLLPSVNFKFNLTDDLIERSSISQTITRVDYSALSGALSLADTDLTGQGGNPNLKPLISTNFDTGLAWYFAPRGVVSIDAFMQHLHNYVTFGVVPESFKNQTLSKNGTDVFSTYQVAVPDNISGHVQGVEFDWQQPIGKSFGVTGNYTVTSGGTATGAPMQGMSRRVFNVGGYFESTQWNARINYTYRSAFFLGPDRGGNFFLEGTGHLSAQVGYNVTKWLSLNFTGRNLNNPTLKYYVDAPAQFGKAPNRYYVNGRQYYLTANVKF